MAYQARARDPLLDREVSVTLARRGREGFGLLMVLAGALLGACLLSYSPEDPNWLAATDAAPRNWLGVAGASVAAPLYLVLGRGALGLAAGLLVWGLRFALHGGSERALPRALFVPGWVLVLSLYCASLVPGPGWSHDFGLGGLFGDTAMGALLSVLPIHAALGLKLLSVVIAALAVATGAWVLGFTREDLARAGLFLLGGLGTAMHVARALLSGAARGAARGGGGLRAAWAARRTQAAPAARHPLPGWLRGGSDAAQDAQDGALAVERDGDRIRVRIADAVRTRVRRVEAAPPRAEPVIGAGVARARAAGAAAPEAGDDLLVEAAGPSPAPAPPRVVARKAPPAGPADEPPAKPARPRAAAPEAAYEAPPLDLLTDPATIERHHLPDDALERNARMLEAVLEDYGVKGEIVSVRPGPVVTMYELEPAAGLKASRVIGLADDIARSMSALSARVSTVPGRSVIGIELPNERREKVVLREILAARDYGDAQVALPLALGKDIGGAPVVANLAKMPHLLIAGTTGSGKSVAINTMILSLLYRLSPEDCRLIMIDPKMLELSVYDGIPHLLSPVVTDPKKAVVALKWTVGEMEDRYRKMSRMGVRNIEGYNGRVADALARSEMFTRTVQTGFDDETGDPVFETEETQPVKLPYIVVVVDEMADLMMVAGKEIEACIQRLAQMARASGIHLVMATQRPSVDVITGTIKANFPTRISFHVTSKIDSRTILGEMGAEQLLGMGDMLYMAGGSKITRVHGPFCSDEEVEEIVNHLKAQGPPDYASSVLDGPEEGAAEDIDAVLGLVGNNTGGEDALYDQAVAVVARDRKCSTSYIQRKLGIGYNKAARLVEQMEENGAVTPANHVGRRDILMPDPNE